MTIVDDLLTALNLTELEGLLQQLPATDDELAVTLSSLLTAALGPEAPDAVAALLEPTLQHLFANTGPDIGPGTNPLTASLSAARPGMTLAQLMNASLSEMGAVGLLRVGGQAALAAPDVLSDSQADGDEWAQPDANIPTDPYGLGDGSWDDPAPADLIQGAAPAPTWIPQELRDFCRGVRDVFQSNPNATSTSPEGRYVHIMLQFEYWAWAMKQETPHVVFLDNRLGDGASGLDAVLDRTQARAFAKSLKKLWKLPPVDPSGNGIFGTIQQALGRDDTPNASFWARPDILDVTTREIYEIKPVAQMPEGLRDVFYYTTKLNALLGLDAIKAVLGTWTTGTGFNTPPEGFWMPGRRWTPVPPVLPLGPTKLCVACLCGPGLILYEIVDLQLGEDAAAAAADASAAFLAGVLVKRMIQRNGQAAGDAAARAAEFIAMSPQTTAVVQKAVMTTTMALMVGVLALETAPVLAL